MIQVLFPFQYLWKMPQLGCSGIFWAKWAEVVRSNPQFHLDLWKPIALPLSFWSPLALPWLPWLGPSGSSSFRSSLEATWIPTCLNHVWPLRFMTLCKWCFSITRISFPFELYIFFSFFLYDSASHVGISPISQVGAVHDALSDQCGLLDPWRTSPVWCRTKEWRKMDGL